MSENAEHEAIEALEELTDRELLEGRNPPNADRCAECGHAADHDVWFRELDHQYGRNKKARTCITPGCLCTSGWMKPVPPNADRCASSYGDLLCNMGSEPHRTHHNGYVSWGNGFPPKGDEVPPNATDRVLDCKHPLAHRTRDGDCGLCFQRVPPNATEAPLTDDDALAAWVALNGPTKSSGASERAAHFVAGAQWARKTALDAKDAEIRDLKARVAYWYDYRTEVLREGKALELSDLVDNDEEHAGYIFAVLQGQQREIERLKSENAFLESDIEKLRAQCDAVLEPNDRTVELMEDFYQEAQAQVDRIPGLTHEDSLRDGFRGGWKAALKWVRASFAITLIVLAGCAGSRSTWNDISEARSEEPYLLANFACSEAGFPNMGQPDYTNATRIRCSFISDAHFDPEGVASAIDCLKAKSCTPSDENLCRMPINLDKIKLLGAPCESVDIKLDRWEARIMKVYLNDAR